jgi:hypothetical protein
VYDLLSTYSALPGLNGVGSEDRMYTSVDDVQGNTTTRVNLLIYLYDVIMFCVVYWVQYE